MKYCPYCGASLMGGAVSFCSECGKKIPVQNEAQQSKPHPKGKGKPKKCAAAPKMRGKHQTGQKHPPKHRKNPMDLNYDGYYDDIKPVDIGEQEERMDPELVKRIAILLAGVLILIFASVMLMTLL